MYYNRRRNNIPHTLDDDIDSYAAGLLFYNFHNNVENARKESRRAFNGELNIMFMDYDEFHLEYDNIENEFIVYKNGKAVIISSIERFGFNDFMLFKLVPTEIRYVAGFGKAYTISPETLRSIAAET